MKNEIRITDTDPTVAAYCMWLMLMQHDYETFLYAEPCYMAETNAHITAHLQRNLVTP